MNKYHAILTKVLSKGKVQENKKGNITYLINQKITLSKGDLLDIFEDHNVARRKLKDELSLFVSGERSTEAYRTAGITWWDYCGPILVNSYPT
ncbi:MAG: thymidylate synthase, partial [Sphingobacteriaceae bacterium]|nr:thymidylate synthase [Sphingobacteriaceae bacterium]